MVSLFTQRNLKASGVLALNWNNIISNQNDLHNMHSMFDLTVDSLLHNTEHKDHCEVHTLSATLKASVNSMRTSLLFGVFCFHRRCSYDPEMVIMAGTTDKTFVLCFHFNCFVRRIREMARLGLREEIQFS
jgi:hypothetical protein